MRIRNLVVAPLIGMFLFAGCNRDGGSAPAGPSGVSTVPETVSSACSDDTPEYWGAQFAGAESELLGCRNAWSDPQNILNGADSIFISVGGDSSNSITVFMHEWIFDGPGEDLAIYEVINNEDDAHYDVYLSDLPEVGFKLVGSASTEGTYCIDLEQSGVSGGQYVKIVQSRDVEGYTANAACDSTWGADIDAIGILNADRTR